MGRYLTVCALAAAAALISLAFLSALPRPWNHIDLTLLLLVGLVVNFRFRLALAAAAMGGLVADLLSSGAPGQYLLGGLAAAAVCIFLFVRVFTNMSVAAFVALNVAAVLTASLSRTFIGVFFFGRAALAHAGLRIPVFFLGLGMQVLLALILLAVMSRLKRSFSRSFLVRS